MYAVLSGSQLHRASLQFLNEVREWEGESKKTKWVNVFAACRRAMPGRKVNFWGQRKDAIQQCWAKEMMFLSPGQHCHKHTLDKILLNGACGVILVPVQQQESWFLALGELALDWWDLPSEKEIFESARGTPIEKPKQGGSHLVVFHAQQPEPHQPAPRCHNRSMRAWNDSRFDRDVRAVIEADDEDPRCRTFCKRLEDEYGHVLEIKPHSEVPCLGPDAVAKIAEEPLAKVVPYRCVGLRAAAFKALLDKLQFRGMLQEAFHPQWTSRAFVVANPGANGGWSLTTAT